MCLLRFSSVAYPTPVLRCSSPPCGPSLAPRPIQYLVIHSRLSQTIRDEKTDIRFVTKWHAIGEDRFLTRRISRVFQRAPFQFKTSNILRKIKNLHNYIFLLPQPSTHAIIQTILLLTVRTLNCWGRAGPTDIYC